MAPPEPFYVPDPRLEEVAEARRLEEKARAKVARPQRAADLREPGPRLPSVRTALCVEPRGEDLFVFLPPVPTGADFIELVRAVDSAARDTGLDVRLEGYPPAWSPEVIRFSVTPDPGVLEVNVQPTSGGRECAEQIDQVFDAALHVGLHSEKYLLDGRQEGSGGGNHITLGGPRALESPFVLRPDLLASLVTFVQHHPAISYLFTGLFVGPTSQAPRVDEARHDSLYELEIALARLHDRSQPAPPWQGDWLLRNLLVDVAGNAHRAEISIDKLFDWRSAARPAGPGRAARLRDAAPPAHGGGPGHPGPRARRGLRPGAVRPRRWCAGAPSCTIGSCSPSGCGATSRTCSPSSRSAASGCRATPTVPSSSSAARSWAGSRSGEWRSRCATRSSPGRCWARSPAPAARPASSTRRWSGSRCAPRGSRPSASTCS